MTNAEVNEYELLPLRADHCAAVARLHVIGVDGFLSTLGPRVLKHFYRTYLDYAQACGFVARRRFDGKVVGFVVGTEDLQRHYRTFLLRRLLPMLPALAARGVTEPAVTAGLLRRAQQMLRIVGRRRPEAGNRARTLPSAHLMMMVVHPRHRGQGVGAALVHGFTKEMQRRRVPALVLGVRDENQAARRLYEREGWQPALRERALDGSVSWLYVRTVERGT